MARYSFLILFVQLFCAYHAYQNNKPFYWYLLIFFIPVIGTIAYLYVHFASLKNLENVSETIKSTVNKNYEIDKLMKDAKYSDTITNRIMLADAYAAKQQYHQAAALYKSCLEGFNADDEKTLEKLMVATYFLDDYEATVQIGKKLDTSPLFKKSESRIVYAWSLNYIGQIEKADQVFREMDIRFSNYVHRAEYAKFLIENNRPKEARGLLISLKDEFDGMEKSEQRQKKAIAKEIDSIYKSI